MCNYVHIDTCLKPKLTDPDDAHAGLSGLSEPHKNAMLQMWLLALEHVELDSGEAWKSAGISNADEELIRQFLLDVLVFAHTAPPKDSAPGTAAPIPGGMSQESVQRLLTKAQSDGDAAAYILSRKLPVAKALMTTILSHEAALPLAIVASCGAHHEVRRSGEEALKARSAKADMENAPMVDVLFTLFLGTPQQQQCAPAARRSPADPNVRAVVLSYLCR